MRLAALIRVSTDSQAQQGGSLDDQRTRLSDWARSHGHEVELTYGAEDRSGGSLKTSPGFRQMLADAATDRWDGVVVESTDRFRRNTEDAVDARKHLRECGKSLFILDLGPMDLTGSDPVAEMAFMMMSTLASQERGRFVARGQKAHRTRIARGAWSGGKAPLGYTWAPSDSALGGTVTLAKSADESARVDQIWALLMAGHTPHQICRTMNLGGHRTRNGSKFGQASLQKIARNPIYAGFTYAWTEATVDGRSVRVEGTLGTPGAWAPFVSVAEWEAVQSLLAHRRKSTGSRGGRPSARFLLTGGLGKCGTCGSTLYTRLDAYREHYWCSSTKTERPCGTRPIPREAVDIAVRQQVLRLDLVDLQSAIEGFTSSVELERRALKTRLRYVKRLTAELSQDLDRFAEQPVTGELEGLYVRKQRLLTSRTNETTDIEFSLEQLAAASAGVNLGPMEELVEELRRRFVINVGDTPLLRTQLADAFTHVTVSTGLRAPKITLTPREDFLSVLLRSTARPFAVHESTHAAWTKPRPWVLAPSPTSSEVIRAREALSAAFEQAAAPAGPLGGLSDVIQPSTRARGN